MSNEAELAFAHPSARAEATASDLPLDRISLRDHVVEIDIGAFEAERGNVQRVAFNVVAEVRCPPRRGDDVDRILSYDRITEAIADALAQERFNLLETLAENVAARLLSAPHAHRVFVRIEKMDRGPGSLGVEIVRARGDAAAPAPGADLAPRPHLLHLAGAAADSPNLPGWLDQLAARPDPSILCPGLLAPASGNGAGPQARRRIALLALDQSAWLLADRDSRCVVADSRTELDWAMRQRLISVWAPSRIVLGAADSPACEDPAALAAWLAAELGAIDLLVAGAEAPRGAPVPVAALDPARPDLPRPTLSHPDSAASGAAP